MVTEKTEKLTPDCIVAKIKTWIQVKSIESNGYLQHKSIFDYRYYVELIDLLGNICDQYDKKYKEYLDKLKQLNSEIAEKNKQLQEQVQIIKNKDQGLSDKNNDIATLKKELELENQKNVKLNDKFNKPVSLLKWLVAKFPNYFIDGENKITVLTSQIKTQQTEYEQNQKKWNQEKQRLTSDNKLLKEQKNKLFRTNTDQLGQIATLKDKPSESIGDYEKRENSQIVTEYQAFCTGQALEITTEDIYNYLRKRKIELQDDTKYALFNAEIKETLSKTILKKAYEVQLRQLINKQPTVEFKNFFESYIKQLLSQLELSEELEKQLKKTAEKGFKLITELVSTKPLCQLLFIEKGEIFNTEEYEAATGCPKEGIMKFTVVPGIVSANYQRLMKPIVFTEKSTET